MENTIPVSWHYILPSCGGKYGDGNTYGAGYCDPCYEQHKKLQRKYKRLKTEPSDEDCKSIPFKQCQGCKGIFCDHLWKFEGMVMPACIFHPQNHIKK